MPSNRVKRRIKANALLDYAATGKIHDPEFLIRESIRRTRDKLRKKYSYNPSIANSGYVTYDFPKLMQKEGMELYGVPEVGKLPAAFNKYVKHIPRVVTSKKTKKQSLRTILNIANAKIETRQSAILLYLLNGIKEHVNDVDSGDMYICFGTRVDSPTIPFMVTDNKGIRFFIVTPNVFIDSSGKPIFYEKLYGLDVEKRELNVIHIQTQRYSEPSIKFAHGLSYSLNKLENNLKVFGPGIRVRKSKDGKVTISLVSDSDLTSALPSLIVPNDPSTPETDK